MDFKILAPIAILNLILIIIAMLDLVKRPAGNVMGGNKIIWGVLILFIQFIGPLAYLFIGKKG